MNRMSYADEGLDVDVGAKGLIRTKPTKLAQGTVYNLARFWLKLDTEWSGVLPSAYVNPPIEGLAKFDELKVQVFEVAYLLLFGRQMSLPAPPLLAPTRGRK